MDLHRRLMHDLHRWVKQAAPSAYRGRCFFAERSTDQDALRGWSAPCAGVAEPVILSPGAVAGFRPRDRSSCTVLISAPANRTIGEIHIRICIKTAPAVARRILI